MTVNRAFVDQFKKDHGHPPWVICGDPDYRCLVDASVCTCEAVPWATCPEHGRIGDHAD